jgi:hypothetical protein
MVQRPYQIRRQRPASNKRRRPGALDRREPETTIQVLAREELREIVRRLALGDRPGIAFEPLPSNR